MTWRVTGWTQFDPPELTDIFDAFPEMTAQEQEDIEAAVIKAIQTERLCFSGKYHQDGINGVPIINWKYWYGVSQREWGRLMAVAHGNKDRFGYLDFAWRLPQKTMFVSSMNVW